MRQLALKAFCDELQNDFHGLETENLPLLLGDIHTNKEVYRMSLPHGFNILLHKNVLGFVNIIIHSLYLTVYYTL